MKRALTRSEVRYMQLLTVARNKFYPHAATLLFQALQKQIEPFTKASNLHGRSTDTKHISIHPMQQALTAIYKDVGLYFGKTALAGFKNLPLNTITKASDELEDEIEDFIQSFGAEMIADITETTRMSVKDYIEQAVIDGKGATQMARDLKNHFDDFNRMRALRISRTEVNRANNFASDKAAEMSGLELNKTWLHPGSTKDDRSSHVAASGLTVARDEPFDIDFGYKPMFPHDGSGDAGEEVNCGCGVYYTRK